MGNGCETKRKNRAKFSDSFWHIFAPFATIRRLRSELSHTEALLAEAHRKLRAGGRACADRQRAKVMSKAAEIRGGVA